MLHRRRRAGRENSLRGVSGLLWAWGCGPGPLFFEKARARRGGRTRFLRVFGVCCGRFRKADLSLWNLWMTCKEEGHRKKHHDASQAYFFVTGFPFGFRLHEHDGSSASRAIPKGGPDRPCHPVRPTKNMKEDLLWAHGVLTLALNCFFLTWPGPVGF